MAFRLKVTKVKGREYAAIVENIYSKQRHGSSSRTIRSCGDLIKLRLENPNIDEWGGARNLDLKVQAL